MTDSIPSLDTSVPHSARVWNYWLGGKDNFAADRAVGDHVLAVYPQIVEIAKASRTFLVRAVTHVTAEAGIRQFLDLGTGLPTADNTHEVAQRIAPESRIVYVDNDPLVLVHARALLTSTPQGATDYVDSDVRDPEKILTEAARTLDFSKPVAVMMLGILGNVFDTAEAQAIVQRLMAAVPSGSFLAINDGTDVSQAGVEAAELRADAGDPYCLRSPALLTRFFDGLELLPPGVVSTPRWRPGGIGDADELGVACGLARKP
ncbi:SAM-dependent methyltransferase [Allorhizocola rhizosphaerae]|uniref:SAM-dependent methyltransferase n=1 Tax=Allorhizocola rhizosphaerae TaxID=1872709 RepID=UPI00319E4411